MCWGVCVFVCVCADWKSLCVCVCVLLYLCVGKVTQWFEFFPLLLSCLENYAPRVVMSQRIITTMWWTAGNRLALATNHYKLCKTANRLLQTIKISSMCSARHLQCIRIPMKIGQGSRIFNYSDLFCNVMKSVDWALQTEYETANNFALEIGLIACNGNLTPVLYFS